MTLEAASQSYIQDRFPASQKHRGSAAETKPHGEMLGRLTGGGGEHTMQMKWREARLSGQRVQRKIRIRMQRGEFQRGLNLFEMS